MKKIHNYVFQQLLTCQEPYAENFSNLKIAILFIFCASLV